MKLSENTMEILKNFSTINQGIIVKKGKVLKTLSTNYNIKAEAKVDEEFSEDFAIYDLNKTLGILSMNKGTPAPEILIEKECLVFKGLAGAGKIRQRLASPNMIFGYDKWDKSFEIPAPEAEFTLSKEAHTWILSSASILKCPNIVFRAQDDKLEICALDVKGEVVDDAAFTVPGDFSGKNFQAVMRIENLKIIPGAYEVSVTKKMTKFAHKDKNIVYWIALESFKSEE